MSPFEDNQDDDDDDESHQEEPHSSQRRVYSKMLDPEKIQFREEQQRVRAN